VRIKKRSKRERKGDTQTRKMGFPSFFKRKSEGTVLDIMAPKVGF
jgi:hypothetical protein